MSSTEVPAAKTDFLRGGGELGAMIRAHDWSQTPIGPPDTWSPALRMMVRLLLANRFPLLLWWGPHYVSIYNDAYTPVLGSKHPWALGRPVSECWSEIWHILQPLIDTPFQGGPATWNEDILLEINRYGFVEETHFTIAYSPVPDETAPSGIGGVLATVHEISDKVIAERRVVVLRDLGARVGDAKTAEEACAIAAQTLAGHSRDVPFVLLYLLSGDRSAARLAATAGTTAGETLSPRLIDLRENAGDPWPIAEALQTSAMRVVERLGERFGDAVPLGPWSDPPTTAVVVSIPSTRAYEPAGVMVAGVSARLKLDAYHRDFLELVRRQVAAAIANANEYERERRRAEALAELDRAKTQFFSNVSHEFRTPLTLMLGPVEDLLAESHGPLSPAQRRELEVAHRNSLRLLKLVNTLLDFARIEAGRMQAAYARVDLAAYTAELASSFRSAIERAGLKLVVDCPPLPPHVEVFVDRDMWEKVVLNVVSNAFKHTFEGEIAIRLDIVADGAAVQLTVRDTGVGIPAEELPRLFERFHRVQGTRARSYEGTGIGLALVQELVKLHGGSIAATSIVDQGTTITISIPTGAAHLPSERVADARDTGQPPTGVGSFVDEADAGQVQLERTLTGVTSARVLLADDNADMRAYIARLLGDRYDVEAVSDGVIALESALAHPPDLVLADVMMPRLDGFGLLRALRAEPRTREVPVVLLSARAGEESRVEGLEAGADDYLIKPFAARELLARVGTHIEQARTRAEMTHRLHQALEAGRMGTWDWDPTSGNVVWSKEVEALFGLSPGVFDGAFETFVSLVHPDDRTTVAETIGRAAEQGGDFEVVHRVVWPDGSLHWLSGSGRAYVDNEGRPARMVGTVVDVTQRQQAEGERLRIEQEKDEFLATVSHDLKNPLASISGQAQLIRRTIARGAPLEPVRLAARLESIEAATAQMVGLLDGLLDITRLRFGLPLELERQPTDLVALARRVAAQQQATTEQHEVSVHAEGGELVGEWDAARLERVLGNLIGNAIKFSPGGGQVRVTLRREQDSSGPWAALGVADRGLGIPAVDLPRIFDHFYRGSNVGAIAGTGIGLAGARQIVEQHGGRLEVDSHEGEGTTVKVRLPLTA